MLSSSELIHQIMLVIDVCLWFLHSRQSPVCSGRSYRSTSRWMARRHNRLVSSSIPILPHLCLTDHILSVLRRAAFLIQSPLLLAGLIIVYIYVREPASFLSSSSSSTFSKLKRIDYLGSLTLVLTLGSLLVGMTVKESEGGSTKMMVGFLIAR